MMIHRACTAAFLLVLNSYSIKAMANQDVSDAGILGTAFNTIQNGLDLLIPESISSEDFTVRLGAGFGSTPDYIGSNDHRLRVLPIIDIRYKERLRLAYNQLSYSAVIAGNWQLGPFLKFRSGRRERRNPILAGLGDVRGSIMAGFFARYRTDRMLAAVEYRHSVNNAQGQSVRATFGHGLYQNGQFAVAGILSGKWLSREGVQTNFGVTEQQAARSEAGLPAFDASGGLNEVSATILARYKLRGKYRLYALIGYGRLVGDAANSPLVGEGGGAADQTRLGIGFTTDF